MFDQMEAVDLSAYVEIETMMEHFSSTYSHIMTENQKAEIAEMRMRLNRCKRQANEIMKLNEEFLKTDKRLAATLEFMGKVEAVLNARLKPENPDVPIKIESSTMFSDYTASAEENDPRRKELKENLESAAESFYWNANKVIKLSAIKFPPGVPHLKFKCREIEDVRNHLIEHTDKNTPAKGRYIYSFSCTERGPVIRAVRPYGETGFMDKGFTYNHAAFVKSLARRLKTALNEKIT